MTIVDLLIVIILLTWLSGIFVMPLAGNLIHLLLIVALILVVVRLVNGRDPTA